MTSAMLTWLLGLSARASVSEECPDGVTTAAEVEGSAVAALAAWSLPGEAAGAPALDRLRAQLRCVHEVVAPVTAARVFVAEAAAAHRAGDLAAAIVSMQAARQAEPDLRLPVGLASRDDGFDHLFDSAERPAVADPEELRPAAGLSTYVDGVVTSLRPRERPCVLQVADLRGQVVWTDYVPAGTEIPEDFPSESARPGRVVAAAARQLRVGLEVGPGIQRTSSHIAFFQIWDIDESNIFDCPDLCQSTTEPYYFPRVGAEGHLAVAVALRPWLESGVEAWIHGFTAGLQAEVHLWQDIGDDDRELLGVFPAGEYGTYGDGVESNVADDRPDGLGTILSVGFPVRLYLRRVGVRPYLQVGIEHRSPIGRTRNNRPYRFLPYSDLSGSEVPLGSFAPVYVGQLGFHFATGALVPLGHNLHLGAEARIMDSDDITSEEWWQYNLSSTLPPRQQGEFYERLPFVGSRFPGTGFSGRLSLRWQPYTPGPRPPKEERRRHRKRSVEEHDA